MTEEEYQEFLEKVSPLFTQSSMTVIKNLLKDFREVKSYVDGLKSTGDSHKSTVNSEHTHILEDDAE